MEFAIRLFSVSVVGTEGSSSFYNRLACFDMIYGADNPFHSLTDIAVRQEVARQIEWKLIVSFTFFSLISDINSHSAAQQSSTHQQSDPHRRSPSPPMTATTTTTTSQEVAQRSRWHTVLLEAGGLSAALSEESLRRLRYVLSWLLAATEHLDAQIVLLRDFTEQVDIAKVRRDIVQTVRGAVDVVGKYAGGGALGEGGRRRVRGFVLELPRRWAAAMGEPPVAERESVTAAGGRARRRGHHPHNSERGVSAGMDSPLASPRIHPQRGLAGEEAAQKVLTLATESLDMMRGVMSVVKDSLDRADAWVERLGLQRDGADLSEDSADTDTEQRSILPPSLSSTRR